jgi:hypothetical protein
MDFNLLRGEFRFRVVLVIGFIGIFLFLSPTDDISG